ncbi:MAG: FAD-binding domain-containing protein [Verrucomicrobiota bacterium]
MSIVFPNSRAAALAQLADFVPRASRYGKARNHVVPGHSNVSRLSPATRYRLLLETELADAAKERFAPSTIEKFEQEVWWRLYWKGYLEKRPDLWRYYLNDLNRIDPTPCSLALERGESEVEIMNHFARELVETGYLHNHARMWFAGYWIHRLELPWQLGADFFMRHLLDGDPASNTLSWRWVAGLHTRGKSYLARRSNLEKYVDPEILEANQGGLSSIDAPGAVEAEWVEPPEPETLAAPDWSRLDHTGGKRIGVWLHEEDLSAENSPLAKLRVDASIATIPSAIWKAANFSDQKQRFIKAAVEDGAARFSDHCGKTTTMLESENLAKDLSEWAEAEKIEVLATLKPPVGFLASELPAIASALAERGVSLICEPRPEDVDAWQPARAGFFGYWKKTARLRA